MDAVTKHKMTLTLPSDVEFRLTRTFDAPARLVFAAWTEPKHLQQWFGCSTARLSRCNIDLSVNGGFRYTMQMANLPPGTIFGVYREIAAPTRLVHTQGFVTEGFLSPNCLAIVTFEETNGQTLLTNRLMHNSQSDRDAHLKSGVEQGAGASFDQLETYLRTMS